MRDDYEHLTPGQRRIQMDYAVEIVRQPDASTVDTQKVREAHGLDGDDDLEERLVKSAQGAEGAARLHKYWVAGPGLAKWRGSPTPWTTLYHHLAKYMPSGKAKRTAAEWFHQVFGFWPGSDLNRVTHGHPPRGHKVGPG